ncbi:MAG: aminotransferase class I/II-fold pyridoxal phosphate-dependent enzyme [Candidatus Rokubacteria bacterium]|nr:aminotransferase class I/II-fold pyridoxal phosphate-dependent enzyme [Candidatus Rokubacteria bacterium]
MEPRTIWRPVLDRITPYDAGTPLEVLTAQLGVPALVRLSANESPLGPSPAVVAALQREATRAHLYPDGGSTALREALARRLGVTPDQILVGNGADELIALIAWAAFDPGDEVVVPHPSFEPYTTGITLAGATVRPSPLAGYETDLDDIRRRVTPDTKAIVVCSPHNPATTIVRRRPLLELLDALGDDPPLVVLDEAYRDFVDDPEYPDGVALLPRHPRLLVLRTFSKIAALAGLRVGYVIGSAEAIERLNRVRAPYNVNRLGQVAALAAVEDSEHREKTRVRAGRARVPVRGAAAAGGPVSGVACEFLAGRDAGCRGGACTVDARGDSRAGWGRHRLPGTPAHFHRAQRHQREAAARDRHAVSGVNARGGRASRPPARAPAPPRASPARRARR